MTHQLTEPPVLNTLPPDVLIHLFSFFGGKDILTMRKTCKALESITRERVVWQEAVHRMCIENVLYEPSFDVRNMSQQELEYLSLGSHRFRRLTQSALMKAREAVTNSDLGSQNLSSIPVLVPTHRHISTGGSGATVPNRMHMVPGGRFIVSLNRSHTLEIVDLLCFDGSRWPTGDNIIKPCVTIDDPGITYFTIHPSPDPNNLRIRLRYANEVFQERITFVTEIVDADLSVRPPVMKRTGKMRIVTPPAHAVSDIFTSVNKDIFTLVSGGLITIWNCVTDKCAQWVAPVSACQFFITDTEVIIVSRFSDDSSESGLYIYRVPPLSMDAQELSTYQPKNVEADFVALFPLHVPAYTQCRGSCDWYTGSTQMIWLDLIHSPSLNPTFTRIKLVTDADGRYTIDVLPQSPLGYRIDGAFHSRQRIYDSDEKTLSWWSASRKGSVSCHFGRTFPEVQSRINEDTEAVMLVRSEHGILGEGAWTSLCAVSGRLAYVAMRHNETDPPHSMTWEIVVVDYLPETSSHEVDSVNSFSD